MTIQDILAKLIESNPLQGKKAASFIESCDETYFNKANEFFGRYELLLNHLGKDLDFGIFCYNSMVADMIVERINFISTGNYSNQSFEDVNTRLYNHPHAFTHHMHGLFLAQFLWWDQYQRFLFFFENLLIIKPNISNYLEIGAGHGLYIREATNLIGENCKFDLVDISPTSFEMCEIVLADKKVNFLLQDIFKFYPETKYDFITIGELLEHLEDPFALLKKLSDCLSENGVIYMTTPANAPMIDHIYLFNNADEIRSMIHSCGYEIIKEKQVYAENMDEKKAIKHKAPLMYAAFIKKKN